MNVCPIHEVNYTFVCPYCQAAKIAELEDYGDALGVPALIQGFEDGKAHTTYSQPAPSLTYEGLLETYRKCEAQSPIEKWNGTINRIPTPFITILTRKLKRNKRRRHKRPPHKLFLRRFSKRIVDPSVDLGQCYLDTGRGVLYCYEEGERRLRAAIHEGNRLELAKPEYLAFPPFLGTRGVL